MPRTLSSNALQALLAQNTGEIFLVRLTISHTDLDDDILIVNDKVPLVIPFTQDPMTIREVVNDQDGTHSGSIINFTEGLRKSSAISVFENGTTQVDVTGGTRPNYPITVEAYFGRVGTGNYGTTGYRLVYVGTPGVTVGGWLLEITSSGVAQFRIWDGGSWNTAAAPNIELDVPLASSPFRISGTYDGNNVRVYVNGEVGTTAAALPSQSLSTTSTLTFGYMGGTGVRYWIDDVRIWNTALSAAAIYNSRNKELVGNENGLSYYYPCNDGQYTPFPFEINLPEDSEQGVPDVQLRLDNVDRRITQALRTLSQEPPEVTIDIVTKSNPNTVELGPITFNLRGASYTATTVTGTLAYQADVLSDQFPAGTFNPSNRTGLGYLQ